MLHYVQHCAKGGSTTTCQRPFESNGRSTLPQNEWRQKNRFSSQLASSWFSIGENFPQCFCGFRLPQSRLFVHCITFCSATKQNGGKRILTEMSLSDGGRGLTQTAWGWKKELNCGLCVSVQNLQTVCLEGHTKQWLGHIPVWKEKSFHRVSYWCATDTCPDYITLLHQSRRTPWSALLHLHWNATFLWAWFCVLLGKAPWLWIGGRNVTFFQVWVWAGVEVLVYVGKGCAAPSRGTLPQSDKDSSFSIAVKLFVTRLHQRMQQLFLRTQHQ